MVVIESIDIQEIITLKDENICPIDLDNIKEHQDNCNLNQKQYIVKKLHGNELKYYKDKIAIT